MSADSEDGRPGTFLSKLVVGALPGSHSGGFWSTWHHWDDKEMGYRRCLQASRISLTMVVAEERAEVDSQSVSGRELITLGQRTSGRCCGLRRKHLMKEDST